MRRTFKPSVDGLEPRVVLNAATPSALRTGLAGLSRQRAPSVSGSLSGRFSIEGGEIADAGKTYTLHGSGNVGALGRATVDGTLYSLGFVQKARANGVLNINSPKGNLILSLKGPEQVGYSPLPKTFAYTITGGTGVTSNLMGTGTVTINARPNGTFNLAIRPASR